ncbi:MAG: NAD(+)/NADH kinase [Clostridia bacterium]|nr:NAD(+)/NADH kinase [Clostridia bacterium]
MKFWFYIHPSRTEAASLLNRAATFLENHACARADRPDEADFTVAIGGDGTVIAASHLSKNPIIGINAGTLGYLPKIEPDTLEESLKRIIKGDFMLESRMTLSVSGTGFKQQTALNDAAILTPGAGVIRFTVNVDSVPLMRYTADGLIASTPTGSTGYSLSAGGPIVDPESRSITLTPVAPHTLVNRSIILSPESRISIECEDRSLLSVDGSKTEVDAGCRIDIRRSEETVKFVSFSRESFIERLRKKLS